MLRGALAAGGMVCPIGATAVEWDGLEPELQDTVKRFHLQQLTWLEARTARLHGNLALYDLSVAPLLNQFASSPQA
jgi:TetR/AcrR family transcriptional regulator, transcriptional repressor for nem operon